MISTTPPSEASAGATHSDLAFSGKYAIQGNYNGFEIWDISNPAKPVLANAYTCPASQNDVSVYKNLLFMSSEATNSRQDCNFGGVPEPVSENRVRGIRIFDISDVAHPKLVTSVQTCRGSHTHTVVTQPGDPNNVYIYVSGTAGVRPADELKGCKDGGRDDPDSSRFRLEVIKVPLAKPASAAIVSSPRIFNSLPVPPRNEAARAIDAARAQLRLQPLRGGAGNAGARATRRPDAAGARRTRSTQRRLPPGAADRSESVPRHHRISGNRSRGRRVRGSGLCCSIFTTPHIRSGSTWQADANMSFWHSATFSNDGTKVLFSDEWGGGSQPRCRSTDKPEWGADALFTIENKNLVFHGYYKMPAAQTNQENCVAHNGSLIPIPGPRCDGAGVLSGWHHGLRLDRCLASEGDRLLRSRTDRCERVWCWAAHGPPTGITASSSVPRSREVSTSMNCFPADSSHRTNSTPPKTVHFDSYNTQDQQKFVWPPSFALAKAYLDQLERSNGLAAANIQVDSRCLSAAERANGQQRRTALTQLATQLNGDMKTSSDQPKLKLLVSADQTNLSKMCA